MAEHGVDARCRHQIGQLSRITLDGADCSGEASLGGPPFERSERVRAGVDDGDPVTEPGQRDGEPAGAAAGVENVETGATVDREPGERVTEHRPDDRRAQRTTRMHSCSRPGHGSERSDSAGWRPAGLSRG